ncbi:nuclease-related domain-containing protein [Oceanobacillus salinisoli]|uniref:nuclease-related domain-containing protein n=1 Tax=Oceanobacillus salinisoli TaxID=2678611 RepID=UPI0012E2D727|nr:nuclease-related domain-containing protein [Oceanobacillus salinisoli]
MSYLIINLDKGVIFISSNVNKRDKTHEIWAAKAMANRLIPHHPMKEKVMADLKIKYAEIIGEKEIEYTLSLLDQKKYLIMHNLRLKDGFKKYFQIDSLVLAKQFLLVVEVKNWKGKILFGTNGQVTRIGPDGSEEGYKNPIPQAKTQVLRLKRWLRNHNFPDIPIVYLVVISFPQTIIERKNPQDTIPYEVIHNSDLIFRIEEIEKQFTKDFYTRNQLSELAKHLDLSHCPRKINLFEKYNITPNDLVKGVFCPSCGALPMVRQERKWFCNACSHYSAHAHRPALADYIVFFGRTISNQGAREFLLLPSPNVTKMILQRESEFQEGKTKGKKYKLKWNKDEIKKWL